MMAQRRSAACCTVGLLLWLQCALGAGAEGASLDVPADFEDVVRRGEAALGELTAALEGPHADRAVAALGRIGSAAAAQALLPLVNAQDGELRAAVAWALGRCGGGDAIPALVKLADDPHGPARAGALWALGRLGDLRAADALRRGVRDPDRNVRLALARGIAEGGRKAFFSILVPRLDYEVRWVSEEEENAKGPPKLVETVFWAETDAAVRLAVIQALGKLGVIDAVPALIFAMERETSFNRAAAIEVIEGFGPRAAGVCLGRVAPWPKC